MKKLSICISVLNIIGIICLIYFSILYISHSTFVVNPNAMVPIENWERAGMMLTIGVVPMLAANILGFIFVGNKKNIFMKSVFFIPSIINICLVLHYWFF